jgi:predicted RND superfamily exporter protein
MNVYADFFGRNRLALALIALVFSSIAGYGITFLRIDDVPRKLFASSDEDFRQLEKLFADFGSDDNDCVVVLESDGLFTPEGVKVLRAIEARSRLIDGVVSTQGLTSVSVLPRRGLPHTLLPAPSSPSSAYPKARDEALRHPLVAGQLLSRDGRLTLLFARIRSDFEAIEQVQPIVESMRKIIAEETAGTEIVGRLTGIPTLRTEVIQSLRKIQLRYTVLGVAIAFFVGVVVFRKPGAVFIVTVPPFVGVFWALGVLGLMGEKLNVVNSVMPSMILVIAFCDSTHLLSYIRAARSGGMSRIEACQSAIRHVGLACFMASLTTAIGFGSLMVATIDTIWSLGLDTAIGTMIAFLATMILVPILASTNLNSDVAGETKNTAPPFVDALVGLLSVVTSWPRTVVVLGIVATIYLGTVASRLEPDNRLTETLPTDSESYQTMVRCDEAFGGVLLAHVVVDWPEDLKIHDAKTLGVLQQVHDLFENGGPLAGDGQKLLVNPLSIINVYKSYPGSIERNARLITAMPNIPGANLLVPASLINRFVRQDIRRAIVSVHVRDIGSQAYQPVFRNVEKQLADLVRQNPGFEIHLTGTTVVASRKVQDMISSMNNGLITAAIIIFITMAIAFRSALLGVLCVVPNMFPLVLVAAILAWLDQPLQMATVIVFNIGIGMTVDNTIHLVTRFQQEFPVDWNLKAAIRRTGYAIGSPMLSTVVVLLAGFGSLMISSIPVTRLFSLLACAILGTALIGDLVLLPGFIGTFVRPPRRRSNDRPALLPPADPLPNTTALQLPPTATADTGTTSSPSSAQH